jgi:RimJ/RimL family protein N-acetyltransferase
MTPTLRTRRLVLRPYLPTDEDAFAGLFEDDQVTRWMGMPDADMRTVFRRGFDPGRVTWDIWAVVEDGTFVGHAEIKPSPNPHVDGHELVYALAPGAWGRGLGTEVAAAVTDYGIGGLGLSEVRATVAAENAASLRLLANLGYNHVRNLEEDDGEVTHLLTRRA